MSERNLIEDRERSVTDLWRKGHLRPATIRLYLYWVRRFRVFCARRQLDEIQQMTRDGVRRFTRRYAGPRLQSRVSSPGSGRIASNALHAWSCALHALGIAVPAWQIKSEPPALPMLLEEYRRYRSTHGGVSAGTIRRDIDTATAFLRLMRRRRKPVEQTTLRDIDSFVSRTAARCNTSSVADTCSSLRAFLRFLNTTGKLTTDLASGVMRPRFRVSQRPPRALPWEDVRRVLKSIEKKHSPGRRDFAIILLLATYGMGAAEVLALRLADIDWKAEIIHGRRPKTKAPIELPLLPAVARALTDYLRWERPPSKNCAHVFLRKNMPYEPMTTAAIRHRIRHWATVAGIPAKGVGAHAFRHSHATRQVDAGVNIKIVSDILGHRSVSSTSVYVRVAVERLRGVALRVPR
ncbi:MAG TPA: tyrosine-type recombinase/integrase [Bryobacteraceae bacterium]|jgi:site-specific recombinase XerD